MCTILMYINYHHGTVTITTVIENSNQTGASFFNQAMFTGNNMKHTLLSLQCMSIMVVKIVCNCIHEQCGI